MHRMSSSDGSSSDGSIRHTALVATVAGMQLYSVDSVGLLVGTLCKTSSDAASHVPHMYYLMNQVC